MYEGAALSHVHVLIACSFMYLYNHESKSYYIRYSVDTIMTDEIYKLSID